MALDIYMMMFCLVKGERMEKKNSWKQYPAMRKILLFKFIHFSLLRKHNYYLFLFADDWKIFFYQIVYQSLTLTHSTVCWPFSFTKQNFIQFSFLLFIKMSIFLFNEWHLTQISCKIPRKKQSKHGDGKLNWVFVSFAQLKNSKMEISLILASS